MTPGDLTPSFRRARPDDAARLTDLALASKRVWGYEEALIELWRPDLAFTPERIERETVLVAEQTGEMVGVGSFSQSGDAAELEGLWVHPDWIGRGIGQSLFQRIATQASARGVRRLFIDADPHAEAFYLRLGASRVGSVAALPAGRRLPRLVLPIGAATAGRGPRRGAC